MGTIEYVAIFDDEADILEINDDGSINVKGIDGSLSDAIRGREDSDTFSGTIQDGNSETLEVTTEKSDRVIITIDDGTTDNEPNRYDMIQRIFKDAINDYQFYDEVKNERARSWVDPTFGSKFEHEITNVSGSDANYRIVVESYREMN